MRPARILVVDDDPFLRQLAVALLRKGGHQVSQAASAEEALTSLDSESPDVLVLDVELPEMSGLELLGLVKTRLTCPVVLMSGNGSDEARDVGLDAGAVDYIVKPFPPAEFAARIGAALDG